VLTAFVFFRYDFVHQLMTGIDRALHLPNFSFSVAMSDYYISEGKKATASAASTMQGQPSENAELNAKLINAILTYPTALSELIDAMRDRVRKRMSCLSIHHDIYFKRCMKLGIFCLESSTTRDNS
jgi:hypothetical protein